MIKLESQNYSLIPGLQGGWYVSRHENDTNLTVHLTPSKLLGDQVHCQWAVILWKESLLLTTVSTVGLRRFSELCCKHMCCHLGFVVPFIEHRQDRFSVTVKRPRMFGMGNEHWLQPEVTSSISSQQESQPVLWSFEARHWLLLSTKGERLWKSWMVSSSNIRLVYNENMLFSVATFIYYLS